MEHKLPKAISADIIRCERCGKDHPQLVFTKFVGKPIDDVWNYWATCPDLGDPVLLHVKDNIGKDKN